ncbi:MAG: RNA pyrophosphohydrolase [Sphingorhabdus sp.]
MSDFESLPYRPCAGIMLVNQRGLVFVGQRIDSRAGEAWQMPQGGIDDGEEPQVAALRELKEETGISADLVDVIAQSKDEYYYDLPPELLGKLWQGKWCGQRQWWFLMRFKGSDSDINIGTKYAEFSDWKWEAVSMLPEEIVSFKKKLYERVVDEFLELI